MSMRYSLLTSGSCGRAHGLHGTLHPSVAEAYRAALADAAPDDFIFVGGSSYVVADLLASLQEKP